MKLLHTSDWHVGRRIRGRSRAEEHKDVLSEMVEIAASENVDLTIVAGDLFDVSSPAPEDERLVYRTLLSLSEIAPVVVVAGNHDSWRRLDAIGPLLELGRIIPVARPLPPDEGGRISFEDIGVTVAALPFVSQRAIVRAGEIMSLDPDQHHQTYEARMRQVIDALTAGMDVDTVNILTSHLTVYGATPGGGERESHVFGYALPPQSFPGSLSYVALGHLHRQQLIPAPAPVWYSGSPLQLDFGERGDEKGVLIVTAEPGKPALVTPRALESGLPLVQVEGTLEQVLALADSLGDGYVKVLLDEPAQSGLNDLVREAIPGTVDVVLRSRRASETRSTVTRAGRSPAELFSAYLAAKDVDDPEVVALFREIEQEVAAT